MASSTSSAPEAAEDSRTRQSRRPAPSDFHVAVFCALPLEADAADAVFDEHWDDYQDSLPSKAAGDVNSYTFGVIGRHHVVLVHLSAMGKVHSAAAAAQCRSSFPNIELALIVGVCGVTPYTPEKEEIVLGDVIISDGVVQYDLGRQFPTRFVRKDTIHDVLGRPNVQIRSLLAKLRVLRVREDLDNKAARHLGLLQGHSRLLAQYPGVEHDRLFDSTYRHLDETGVCDEVGCSGSMVIRHRLEPALEHRPVAHVGLIASGDTVMKSGEMRDAIAKKEKVIAFEMESAGVWDNFPCVVIKGACDYADSHKSKRWQRYAAVTAAAYMKAFLDYWTPSSKAVWCHKHQCTEALLYREQESELARMMDTRLLEGFDRVQNHVASSMQNIAISISKTLVAANDSHNLGQIVRAELKRQLTPFSDNFGQSSRAIDEIATHIAKQAHEENIFEPSNYEKSRISPSHSPANSPGPVVFSTDSPQESLTRHGTSLVLSHSSNSTLAKHQVVPLLSTFNYFRTPIGVLFIKVTSYRIRNSVPRQNEKYFRLTLHFLPNERLCLHGLSIAYSSGPDNAGYYDILPRIQLYSIIPNDSPLYQIVNDDDLSAFVGMLRDRRLSIRDRTTDGQNLFLLALYSGAPAIARYILHESGYKELVDDLGEIPFFPLASLLTRSPPNHIEELLSLAQECADQPHPHSIEHDMCWNNIYVQICKGATLQDAAWLTGLFFRNGRIFLPICWIYTTDMARKETYLKLYLDAGGDPNIRDEYGRSLLTFAMFAIDDIKRPETSDQELPDRQMSGEAISLNTKSKSQDHQRCINLLTLLMSAGVDIHEFAFGDEMVMVCELADDYEIYDIWEEALCECGFNGEDVWQESMRRKREMNRLEGATRTGVDVRVLDEQSSGLRFRGRRNDSGS